MSLPKGVIRIDSTYSEKLHGQKSFLKMDVLIKYNKDLIKTLLGEKQFELKYVCVMFILLCINHDT